MLLRIHGRYGSAGGPRRPRRASKTQSCSRSVTSATSRHHISRGAHCSAIYDRLGELGFQRRPFEEVRTRLDAWHDAYVPHLSALVSRLLIAPEFRLPPSVVWLSYD